MVEYVIVKETPSALPKQLLHVGPNIVPEFSATSMTIPALAIIGIIAFSMIYGQKFTF